MKMSSHSVAAVLVAAALTVAAGTARAQFLDAGIDGDSPSGDSEGQESQEGLQQATPTDNVNELNTNPTAAGNAIENGDGGDGGDFPAANSPNNTFDVEGTEGGDDMFENGVDAE